MWADLARATARTVPDTSVADVADALDYLCLAQLYLRDNPLLERPLTPADLKRPAGHWGVCPPVNRVLAALGPRSRRGGISENTEGSGVRRTLRLVAGTGFEPATSGL
ncbi:hypothetical protein [Streptomyces sp. NPDC017435]|uniref:hypothetical protein n=1 Tax=Streptomyces sp. NPDC017435 TaxID=3364995 RepID=UPI0037B75668